MNLISIVLIILLITILIVFWIRNKVIGLMHNLLKLTFLLCLILSIIGIFLPKVYSTTSDFVLKKSNIYGRIVQMDKDVPLQKLLDTPTNFLNILRPNQEKTNGKTKGLLEQSVYTILVDILAFLLRMSSLIISFGGLLLVVYLTYISTGLTEVIRLNSTIKKLEDRVSLIENQTAE